ncbi:MAG: hypothetical protein LBV23_02800 [Deltaproteobacteria bacterium]|nr:hypothetical protein [Deltaproteobacteria bacterium]
MSAVEKIEAEAALKASAQSTEDANRLVCPICSSLCHIDPTLFPLGETAAECSVCRSELILGKDEGGLIKVKRVARVERLKPNSKTKPKAKETFRVVVCPKCLGRYKIPVSKIPQEGAWETCPNCGERYVVKINIDDILNTEPSQEKKPKIRHGTQFVGGLDSSGAYRAVAWAEVTPLNQLSPLSKRNWGIVLVGCLVVVFAVEAAIFYFSWRTARNMGESPQAAKATEVVYDENSLASDLKVMQNQTINAKNLDYNIGYTGSESRVYKYVAAVLDPTACTQITSLRLKSDKPWLGFSLKATCLDSKERSVDLEVNWNDREAMVFVAGHERTNRLKVVLY